MGCIRWTEEVKVDPEILLPSVPCTLPLTDGSKVRYQTVYTPLPAHPINKQSSVYRMSSLFGSGPSPSTGKLSCPLFAGPQS
jgi:hypothetical protein